MSNASGIAIDTPPQHGAATVSGFTVTYTVTPGYFGLDSFTYSAVGLPGSGGGSSQRRALPSDAAPAAVSAPAVVSITIPAPTVTVRLTTLPAGAGAVAYSQTITATGGTAPYSFSVSTGALPAGLTLSSAGVLSGTPTASDLKMTDLILSFDYKADIDGASETIQQIAAKLAWKF